jgi:hypothetical protein
MFKAKTSVNDVAATTSITLAQEECYRSDWIDPAGLTASEYGIIVANQSLRDVALASMGRSKCSVVTVYDSQIAEVEAKTSMVTGSLKSIAGVAINGIYSMTAVAIVDKAGASFETSGDEASIAFVDESDSGNELNVDSLNPSTNNDSNNSSSSTNTSGGGVGGEDLP